MPGVTSWFTDFPAQLWTAESGLKFCSETVRKLMFVKYIDLLLWPCVEFGCSASLTIRPLIVLLNAELEVQLWTPACLKNCCSRLLLSQTHLPPKSVEAKTEKWLQNLAISNVSTENGKQGSLQDANPGSARFRDRGWHFPQGRQHLLPCLCAASPTAGCSGTFWCCCRAHQQEWYQPGDPRHRLHPHPLRTLVGDGQRSSLPWLFTWSCAWFLWVKLFPVHFQVCMSTNPKQHFPQAVCPHRWRVRSSS